MLIGMDNKSTSTEDSENNPGSLEQKCQSQNSTEEDFVQSTIEISSLDTVVAVETATCSTELIGSMRNTKSQFQHDKQKSKSAAGPYFEFEEDELSDSKEPTLVRTALGLEDRFFPEGIRPGYIVEVKGSENSGKTFLLTYFLAWMLHWYPTKSAILIDTSHQFSLRNLVGILANIDKKIKLDQKDRSLTLLQILEMNPKLNDYLDRLFIIKCNSAEEFLLTLLPEQNSLLGKMIQNNSNISLVAIDCVDNYSFVELGDRTCQYKILSLLKKAVGTSFTPIICTTIKQLGYYERQDKETAKGFDKKSPKLEAEEPKPWFSNLIVEPNDFTHVMSIVPSTEAEKKMVKRPAEHKNAQYATAYLRSRHKANIAGSVANHLVKFSIFSDMVWVQDKPNSV